ncbi:MAG TPA: cupin domain-containing protein [Pyrinomonadaceae bacterium]|nr:cupin domain-containing protein [Pyrinomonadaceae bacterium]
MISETSAVSALVTDWSRIKKENPAPGIQRQMVVGENVMMVRFTFEPFLVTPEHTHPHEQMTLVVQGKVKFLIEGEAKIVSPGDVLHFPPHNRHGATMLDEEVVLIDIFSPIREDFLAASTSNGNKSKK